jgi:phosphoesterase RecJ-like protein
VVAALNEASRLLLVGHVSPDGDSMGSLFGLSLALTALGKDVTVFVEGGVPDKYRFLPGAETAVADPARLPTETVTLVVLDCGEFERTGLPEYPFRALPTINIDHHRTSQGFGEASYIDSAAAATGELVLAVLSGLDVQLDADIATCLYTAIASDTGFFQYSNTTASVHRAIAQLLDFGARQQLVAQSLGQKTPQYLQLLALVLQRIETFADGLGAYSWLTHEDLLRLEADGSMTEGLVDYPRSLAGVELAFLLTETSPGVCKLSLRSQQRADVSQLAQEFGGGGHARAAGATIDGQPRAVIQRVVSSADRSIRECLNHTDSSTC